MMTRRLPYIIATLVLLMTEVVIALFVHDRFIRPYIGDVLVVIVVYSFLRIFIPEGFTFLPLGVFIFASFVELLQLINIVELLGVENNAFLRVLIGSTFDIKDIGCYGAGCLILGALEYYRYSKLKGKILKKEDTK